MSDPTGEQNIDQKTGTALPSDYSERQGEVGPKVLQLNLAEQREELAETMGVIRRKLNGRAVIAALASIVLAVVAVVVGVKTSRARTRDRAGALGRISRG